MDKGKNTVKVIAFFYWVQAVGLGLLTILLLSPWPQGQGNWLRGFLIFLIGGFVFYTISFANLGWKLWNICTGAATHAVNFSVTFVPLGIIVFILSLDDLNIGYTVMLLLCCFHGLIVWRLTRVDMQILLGVDMADD